MSVVCPYDGRPCDCTKYPFKVNGEMPPKCKEHKEKAK